MAGEAAIAVAAEDGEAGDDVVARLDVGNLLADLFDDASGFVAEDCGRRERPLALYEVEVAVADAAGSGAHDDLAGHGLVVLDLLDC